MVGEPETLTFIFTSVDNEYDVEIFVSSGQGVGSVVISGDYNSMNKVVAKYGFPLDRNG